MSFEVKNLLRVACKNKSFKSIYTCNENNKLAIATETNTILDLKMSDNEMKLPLSPRSSGNKAKQVFPLDSFSFHNTAKNNE